jgi:hypothetical protein
VKKTRESERLIDALKFSLSASLKKSIKPNFNASIRRSQHMEPMEVEEILPR